MLTVRQNFLETIHGGKPDRFVKQYEFMQHVMDPARANNKRPLNDGIPLVDNWGVTKVWPIGTPGPFPIHDAEHIVCKDIENWRDYVRPPKLDYPVSEWERYGELAKQVDRSEYFAATFISPGMFEQLHYLCEIQNALMAFYEYPDEVAEIMDCIEEYEMRLAELVCKYIKPDALFHHDDWGSQQSTFLKPEMFREFIKPHYEKVYGYYKDNGVEIIVHHSDSYAETLVPDMIDMHIDVWQGVMTTNNINKLIEEYGGKISFMGGIDSAKVDNPETSHEIIAREVRWSCETFGKGKHYYIPCTTMGGPESIYPGVYEKVANEIDKMSAEMF